MNAPFGWPGGKRYLLKTLLRLIPEHKVYVEVFSGSAKLLFAKQPSHWEILNDVNDDLLNFFRVAKHRPAELAELFTQEFIGVGRFKDFRAEHFISARHCELQQAKRFAYLIWWSFGSKGEHFAHATLKQIAKKPLRKTTRDVAELLQRTSDRLREVVVDQRDFADCIARYDAPATFFYLDPPYTKFQDNGRYVPMDEKRNRELLDLLRKIKGKFLLSFDDAPLIRELASAAHFTVRTVGVLYTLGARTKQKKVQELLIANYQLPR
jgi:DNA adenine methylase